MAPLPLAASAEAGSSMTSTMHKIKRMMRLRFFSLQRALDVFRMHCGRGQFQQSWLRRFTPVGVGRRSNQFRSARPICSASVSAQKPAGRPTLA
jgi:hypothetical protein